MFTPLPCPLAGCPSGDLPDFQLGPLQSWVDMELVICICLYMLGCVVGFWLAFSLLDCFDQAAYSALKGFELIGYTKKCLLVSIISQVGVGF